MAINSRLQANTFTKLGGNLTNNDEDILHLQTQTRRKIHSHFGKHAERAKKSIWARNSTPHLYRIWPHICKSGAECHCT